MQSGTGPSCGKLPPPDAHPAQLDGDLLTLDQLQATPEVALPPNRPTGPTTWT